MPRCLYCGKRSYSDYCFAHKIHKRIAQKGRKTVEYEKWRDEVAIPYLVKKYGRKCAACAGARCHNRNLDVDHKIKRSLRPDLVMELSNVQFLGRIPCHAEKDRD